MTENATVIPRSGDARGVDRDLIDIELRDPRLVSVAGPFRPPDPPDDFRGLRTAGPASGHSEPAREAPGTSKRLWPVGDQGPHGEAISPVPARAYDK